MASKKTFAQDIAARISPAEKFLTGQPQEAEPLTTERETIKGPDGKPVDIEQVAFTLSEHNTGKKILRSVTTSIAISEQQRETLRHLAIVKNITVNELLNRFIDKGIEDSAEDLQKWEKIKEVLNND